MAPPKPQAGAAATRGGGEDAAIDRIRRATEGLSGAAPPGEVWIGDDAALVRCPPGGLLLAVDAVVAGVHADLSLVSLADLGWKAHTVAVSDIAAMGGEPGHALVALCVPPGTEVDQVVGGLAAAAARWGCPVVGGDLSEADQLVAAVTVTGTIDEGGPPALTRTGAAAGDRLFVTGPLGGSAAGLRLLSARAAEGPGLGGLAESEGWSALEEALVAAHRRPEARLAEGREARRAGASAAMDISDGLGVDLDRLARASGVGVRLWDVPVRPGATLEEALGGGEDYELVLASPDPDRLVAAFAAAGLRPPLVVGECTADPGERTLAGRPLARSGWEHRVG